MREFSATVTVGFLLRLTTDDDEEEKSEKGLRNKPPRSRRCVKDLPSSWSEQLPSSCPALLYSSDDAEAVQSASVVYRRRRRDSAATRS